MQKPISEIKGHSMSLSGLDEVFDVDTTVIEGSDQPRSTVRAVSLAGLTIKQASDHYRLAVPTIRLKIKTGEIPATKVNGPKGPEWRVFPDGVPATFSKVDINDSQPDSTFTEGFCEADRTVAEGFHQANINLATLIKSNQELISKLEAVTYRNGYLEAQLAEKETQIKLLTDTRRKGWWGRFCSWALGRPGD